MSTERSKFAERIVVNLNCLVVPEREGACQEVSVFPSLWDDKDTITAIKAYGKKIIGEALRNTIGKSLYKNDVVVNNVSGGLGIYTIKLTQEAVNKLMQNTEKCRYDSVTSRLEYAICYNRED